MALRNGMIWNISVRNSAKGFTPKKITSMPDGYKGKTNMDCGYFMGGGNGLVWFPPVGHSIKEPVLIPWEEVLGPEEDSTEFKQEGEE
jgi:hypothetical protein